MRGLVLVTLAVAAAAPPALAADWRLSASPLDLAASFPLAAKLPPSLVGDTRPTPSSPALGEQRAWNGDTTLRRVRISYERENFYTGAPGGKLGLGQAFTFNQDIVGAKLAFLGGEDSRFLPQLAVGIQYRRAEPQAVFAALGPARRKDYYASATKLMMGGRLMLNGAVRLTKTDRAGFYGLTPVRNGRRKQYEASAAYLPMPKLAVGIEHRSRPDDRGFTKRRAWTDAFVAYAFNRRLSASAAYVELGRIDRLGPQRGLWLSLQAGF
jgi:hypothetical protein